MLRALELGLVRIFEEQKMTYLLDWLFPKKPFLALP